MWNDTRPGRTQPETKLLALRSRTDQDLAALFRKAMGRSLQELSDGSITGAEAAYAQAAALLHLLQTLPAWDLQTLGSRLEALRAELDKAALLQPLAG